MTVVVRRPGGEAERGGAIIRVGLLSRGKVLPGALVVSPPELRRGVPGLDGLIRLRQLFLLGGKDRHRKYKNR